MIRTRNKSSGNSVVSLTPMIDAVFLLLIFFLVATMAKKQKRDIEIELPDSRSAAKLVADDKRLVLGIDANGVFYLDGAPTTLNIVHDELRTVAATNPSRQIRIDADRQAPARNVVQILDLCQFRGLQNVGLRTYDRFYNR